MSEARTFVLTHADIMRCPVHALSPQHYYPDGSCRCSKDSGHPDETSPAGGD